MPEIIRDFPTQGDAPRFITRVIKGRSYNITVRLERDGWVASCSEAATMVPAPTWGEAFLALCRYLDE